MGWYPMAKRVTNLDRYAQVSLAANRRYLDALAAVDDPSEARHSIRALARRVRKNGRSYRGFNPADYGDIQLFAAVMRGEHVINGFRNQDIRRQLFKPTRNASESTRQRARVSRLLKQLHIHGLIAKIPRSRRWRVTHHGHIIMTTVLTLHHEHYTQLLTRQAG